MRLTLALVSLALAAAATSASAQRVAPVRVEQTRPGGLPGAPRDMAGGADRYMLAPAQPQESKVARKRRR